MSAWWQDCGFWASPYDVRPLPSSGIGNRILVGREGEVRELQSKIASGNLHATINGPVGVGKTSLIAVVGYRLNQAFLQGEAPLIPLRGPLPLHPTETVSSFERKLCYEVAHAFIENYEALKTRGYHFPRPDDVRRWLRDPVWHTRGLGGSALGSGATYTRGKSATASPGYVEFGLPTTLAAWLDDCFHGGEAGGFICTIDNLELIWQHRQLQGVLESLRDTAFSQRGLRWILCGAEQVVRTLAATPRLHGRLDDPIDLKPIGDDKVGAAIEKRHEVYARDRKTKPIPILGPEEFLFLYDKLGKSLRDSLRYADSFSGWAHRSGNLSTDAGTDVLRGWLIERGVEHYHDASYRVKPRAWQLFDDLVAAGGFCTYSQHKEFSFPNTGPMRDQMQKLIDANLVRTERAPGSRRHSLTVTPMGHLVAVARSSPLLQPVHHLPTT
ncbi:hypothetical protein ACIQU3_19070 [Streptomyces sp. NPDC101110]|uniref:hypothetical protein n=1 Tax=Streptomyces sp. NPDC101110 TaxID=3366104 RepID=UPI003827F13F